MKLITFTVPCYNSAAYMDHCIETLLTAGEDAEIILVDDAPRMTPAKLPTPTPEKYPTIVRVIHQENGGHGEASTRHPQCHRRLLQGRRLRRLARHRCPAAGPGRAARPPQRRAAA